MNVEITTEATGRQSRKYARAPITEAIIEIRVDPTSGVNPASCKSVFNGVRDEFPEMAELMLMRAQILGGPQVGASATQTVAGYTFVSKERGQIVTACPDRFAFSQLPPYDRWETFCPLARRLWEIYRMETKPDKITRIATRFVNRIEIPMPIKDIADYFRTLPVISPGMFQDLSGYFMQIQLPQNDLVCMATLNQALLASDDHSVAPFILDIDISDEQAKLQSDEVIWNRLQEFRWRKNDIFEACITDQVRELIS